jgi:hypothetical protein
MSYDLAFWRQAPTVTQPADEIYNALLGGQRVEGVIDLQLGPFLEAIVGRFPGAVREPNGDGEWIFWEDRSGSSMFEVSWSPQHVLVNCRGISEDAMNELIDIAIEHGCSLYDPQVNHRFG